MKIRLRLGRLLKLDHPNGPSISKVAEQIGIGRHQLSHLLDNESKHINRHALEAVCAYLIRQNIVTSAELPYVLFSIKPDRFWTVMQSCKHVLLTMGARWDKRWRENLVVEADSVLHSTMLNRITNIRASRSPSQRGKAGPRLPVLESRLTVTWVTEDTSEEQVRKDALEHIEQNRKDGDGNALICLGSVKSNPLCEPVIADVFNGAEAFRSEDDVANPGDRSCPFVMIYRQKDAQLPSCWAGTRLCSSDTERLPGFYYESENGKWEHVAWKKQQDIALVFFWHDSKTRRVEMVLGGFTARGTRCLAEMLKGDELGMFWPPAVRREDLDVGVFLVKFMFRSNGDNTRAHKFVRSKEVIRLPRASLEKRLAAS